MFLSGVQCFPSYWTALDLLLLSQWSPICSDWQFSCDKPDISELEQNIFINKYFGSCNHNVHNSYCEVFVLYSEVHVKSIFMQVSVILLRVCCSRSHTGERPYKCVQCSRGFASSGVLKAHIRTHSGLKAYKCLMCDTTFTTSGSLRRHMTTHSDLRPYMCPYCQKTFKSSPNCRKHMKTHRFGSWHSSSWLQLHAETLMLCSKCISKSRFSVTR